MSKFASYAQSSSDMPYFSFTPQIAPAAGAREETVVKRLFIDNRDKHASSKSDFDFKVFFNSAQSSGVSGYKNVLSVELKGISFPKVQGERYVIISIDELNDNLLDATNSVAHNAFAVVYFDADSMATGTVKPLKGTDFYQKQIMFRPPLAKLNSLSIKFLKWDGSVINPATDTANNSHVSLLLEITSRKNRNE